MKDRGEFVHKYQIKDLENISGIKAHTIRIWEQRYSLFDPERTSTNIRYYTDSDLKKLLNIAYLLRKGFRISEFKELSDVAIAIKVRQMSSDEPEEEAFLVAILDFNYAYFNNLIEKAVVLKGKQLAAIEILYPLIKKIGVLWLTGSINPAHEHFFSNIIKQKFFSWIDSLPEPENPKKTFLMFLPYFEQHEIGLLFSYFLAKSMGHRVIYLGQNVPTEDVVKVSKVIEPDYLLCFFVSNVSLEDVTNYLDFLSEEIKGSVVLASGFQVTGNLGIISKKVILVNSPEQFSEILGLQ